MDTAKDGPVDDQQPVALKFSSLEVDSLTDDQGPARLVLTDGQATVELISADADMDTLIGLRRLSRTVWTYQQEIIDRRLARERAAAAEALPGEDARIAELRGSHVSTSGPY